MSLLALVDETFEGFGRGLSPELAGAAVGLSHMLGLAPRAGFAWSEVFRHEIVLAAPGLFAEAVPGVGSGVVREAVRAHSLGIVHAFASDRLGDGEVVFAGEPSVKQSFVALLEAMRRARDAALTGVLAGSKSGALIAFPDDDVARAVAEEQAQWALPDAADFAHYVGISRRKQGAAATACCALALAAGWPDEAVKSVRDLFDALALGLQMYDDAIDWQKDVMRGSSWAAALAGAAALPAQEASVRIRASSVLPRLVEEGRRHFEDGRVLAAGMNATAIATWAAEQGCTLERAARDERRAPGHVARAHDLAGWLRELTS